MQEKISLKEKNLELYKLWVNNKDNSVITENIAFIYAASDEVYFSRSTAIKMRISQAEVRQEGVIGFIKGLSKFDPDKGYAITTYTKWWIYACCMEFCGKQFQIKIGTTNEKNKAIVALYRDSHKYLDKDGKEDLNKLSEISGIDLSILQEVQIALQIKYMHDTNTFTVLENIDGASNDHNSDIDAFYKSTKDPEYLLDLKQKIEILYDSKKELLDQNKGQVYQDLINFFILPGEFVEPLTLEEIAKKNGYPAKQNVSGFKDNLEESLKKKFMERYRGYHKKAAHNAVPTARAPGVPPLKTNINIKQQ